MKRCQTCKHHSNNPSRCECNDQYVGRKDPGCETYVENKKKVQRLGGNTK